MSDALTPPISCDILIAGAGPTGLLAAIVLAKAGRKVIVAGRAPGPLHGRTVALFEGSLAWLRTHGLEDLVTAHSARIAGIRIIDDTGSAFSPQPVTFLGSEIGLEALGRNIPNDDFAARLDAFARDVPGIERREALVRSYDFSGPHARAMLADGTVIDAALIIAADGRASPARMSAGIGTREWSYPQIALTAVLAHRRPHHDVSTEFHTRSGPFTFVPMPGEAGTPHRSSLVWLMDPQDAERRAAMPADALATEIAERAHHRFGAIKLESPLGKFPMKSLHATRLIAPRLALIGEAAHAFPPLAAQGLNLGIRDVADLCKALSRCKVDDTTVLRQRAQHL